MDNKNFLGLFAFFGLIITLAMLTINLHFIIPFPG